MKRNKALFVDDMRVVDNYIREQGVVLTQPWLVGSCQHNTGRKFYAWSMSVNGPVYVWSVYPGICHVEFYCGQCIKAKVVTDNFKD